MGFLNSESLAQNVHRNLVQWSGERVVALGSAELRKDRPFTVANPSWRVYLDNYDLLATWRRSLPLVSWNWKEAWPRASWRCVSNIWYGRFREMKRRLCELQGATLDGVEGIGSPRLDKRK